MIREQKIRDVMISSHDIVPSSLTSLLNYTPTSALRVQRTTRTLHHEWEAEIFDTADDSSIFIAFGHSAQEAVDVLQLLTSRLT